MGTSDEFTGFLRKASEAKPTKQFVSKICGNEWDRFIEEWAGKCHAFLEQALGPFPRQPRPEILGIPDGYHSAGVNASFQPDNGQIRLVASVVDGRPGTTLEKLLHELTHASLVDFPEGDPFYEESVVDYSVWIMAHAPVWEPYRAEMIKAAAFNIECRRDRAMRDLSDYDRKRWAGGVFCALVHGPWIITKLKARKEEGDLRW